MASEDVPNQSKGAANLFAGTEGIYPMPHHPSEIKRLQRQHALFLSSTGGVLVTIPLEKSRSEFWTAVPLTVRTADKARTC
jgi:hypothetical protein